MRFDTTQQRIGSFGWWCLVIALAVAFSDTFEDPAHAGEVANIVNHRESSASDTAQQLLALPQDHDSDPQMVPALLGTARAVGRQNEWQLALSLLQRAQRIEQSRFAVTGQPSPTLRTIQLAAASAASQCHAHETVLQFTTLVLDDPQAAPAHVAACFPLHIRALQGVGRPAQASEAIELASQAEACLAIHPQISTLALNVGADCLKAKDGVAAARAYQAYLTLNPDGAGNAEAELGLAWATVYRGDQFDIAAQKLADFVKQHPEHRDAAHALQTAAVCYERASAPEQAEAIRQLLREKYPQSDAAQAIAPTLPSDHKDWTETLRAAWRDRLSSADTGASTLTAAQVAGLFQGSLHHSDDGLWQATLAWLAKSDPHGQLTESVLQELAQDDASAAEHLAIDVIALAQDSTQLAFPSVSAAACRWAGANERWSLLALVADDLGPPTRETTRSVDMDRILAESLMQMQRPMDALKWWDNIIDVHGAIDFATLLRGAETSVAYGDIETALRRVDAAKQAAAKDPYQQALVHLVVSDLAIRRARFDEARESLAQVVRDQALSGTLAPRAQWMMGETFFLQQRYLEAIDAYRKVDSMDAAGPWAPAALLQAGKAFEKLGRGRDAAICYTALLNRFRDWPHAGLAQTRLAALAPHADGPVLR